ncbi:MAG: hypothetical protein ACYCX3_15070 [Thermoleophilia bacterium]
MRRLILTLALVALLALALVGPAAAVPNGPPADVTEFVTHVVPHAEGGEFSGAHNPGKHQGLAGFAEHH